MSTSVRGREVAGVHVVEAGDGPVVLCLHGISSSAAAFAPQMGRLGARRTVAWDAPGYGRSPDPDRPLALDDHADAAVRVLDALGVEQAAVLGVSWGGVIATRVALRHPGRVAALVLADSTVGSGADPDRAAAMRARPSEVARAGIVEVAARRAPRLLSDAAPGELVARVADTMVAAVRPLGFAAAAESMAATDHTGDLPDVAAPTLVLVGEHDQVTPRAEAERLAAGIPSAALAVVPSAGHLANQEQPAPFNQLVTAFLDRTAPAPNPTIPLEAAR